MDINAAGGSKAGATDDEIAAVAVWQTSPLFGEKDKLAFELADATIGAPVDVSDELFDRLRRQYTTDELVELAAICALENFRSRPCDDLAAEERRLARADRRAGARAGSSDL